MKLTNFELKAKYADFEKAKKLLKEFKAEKKESMHQIDTYYNIPAGRLKLRDFCNGSGDLIFYERENKAGVKKSKVLIYPTKNPIELNLLLGNCLGEKIVVDKKRELFLIENVRIHLDEVKNLGKFIEIEAVAKKENELEKCRKQAFDLKEKLKIKEKDLIECSYADLLGRKK